MKERIYLGAMGMLALAGPEGRSLNLALQLALKRGDLAVTGAASVQRLQDLFERTAASDAFAELWPCLRDIVAEISAFGREELERSLELKRLRDLPGWLAREAVSALSNESTMVLDAGSGLAELCLLPRLEARG
ncbi:MAG: hypothetical protein K1X75_05285 [Leptospirales bacterium]|nr:hypothetical protein [Leptospirales bacterium]